jgi:DNA-binding transcriptional MerR regulator
MKAAPELRIGELAARCGRSVHTIRWYDAQGLIPGVVRDAAGRRLFSHRHVQWLGLVDRLRDTGMTISQIRNHTALVTQGRAGLGGQREMLAAHRDRVAATIQAWQASLALIESKLDFYDQWISTRQRPQSESVSREDAAAARAAKGRAGGRRAKPR